MSKSTLFHKVQPGDTLSGIAQSHGTSTQELQTINGIKNPDRINSGQIIVLKPHTGFLAQILLLDSLLNPIKKVRVRLDYCGKREIFTSGNDGLLPLILTDAPGDVILIFIAKLDGTWKKIDAVKVKKNKSRYTVISPKTKHDEETQPHPKGPDGLPIPEPNRRDKNPASPTDDRLPYKKPKNDQVQLDCFDEYTEECISNEDFKWAAKELDVEEAVIRAIIEVEAAGKGFVKLKGRKLPKFCYERHYFYKLTEGKYTASNPDISWKQGYYQKEVKYLPSKFTFRDSDGNIQTFNTWRRYTKKDNKRSKEVKTGDELFKNGTITIEKDAYSLLSVSYKRLAKAYTLNKEAALSSCSWGAFQIMGKYFNEMKYPSVTEFVKAMSRSEREHIRAFVKYCKYVNPAVIKVMKEKDFAKLAAGYNGPSYSNNNYDKKLFDSYNKWSKK